VTKFELSHAGYASAAAGHFQRQLQEKVAQLPGVEAAAYGSATPLSQDTISSSVFAQQTTDFRPSNAAFDSYVYDVSPGYFAAAQTPLLEGRDVSFTDTAKTPPVAVVNQHFARQLFHSEHAVGRYFKNDSGVLTQIVGVVADGKYLSLTEDQGNAAFLPISQQASTKTSLIVRLQPNSSAVAANEMAATVGKVVRQLDPTVPIQECSPWNNQLGLTFFVSQVATVALGIFGAFGLLLSIAGTFGLASYTVSKRLRELSIRVALGAQARQILSASLGRLLILIASGSVVGIMLAATTSRLLSAIVYQASAQDPFVLVAVAFTMMLTASLSVAGPVRRALHINPAILLREQ
jgi:ABC-type antimicrobial peptide transport system permease subunit